MSHVVTVATELRDPAAVAAACRRLGLRTPARGTVRLFEGEAAGLLVRLPGWLYPVAVQTKGFTGPACRDASRFLEQALGTRTAEALTADFHQRQGVDGELRESQ